MLLAYLQKGVKTMPTDNKRLVRARAPECVGISSDVFKKMIDLMDEKGMRWHSLMVIRHGKVAAECYRAPFSRDLPHIMYSVSKTVTATAVGIAIHEGYLRLDTRFLDVFPEYAPKKTDEKLEKLQIKHLLTMTSGKMPSYLLNKTDKNWLRHLLDAKWISEPGERFEYVNENIYALCAILQRVTGMTVVDYLYERFFEPLGIDKPFWETDHNGVESGGWGIFLKTEELAKIMLCYMNDGRWKNKQLIPKDWAREAIVNHRPDDNKSGYGYCIWITNENEYRADGMYCQIATTMKDKDTVIAMTGCSQGGGAFWDAVKIFREEGLTEENPGARASAEFKAFIENRPIDIVPVSDRRSPLEDFIAGRTIRFKKDKILNTIGFPMSVLNLASVYMTRDRAGNIDNVRFEFYENELRFFWQENDEINSILCGLDGKYRMTPIVLAQTPYTAAAAAFWLDNYTLEVHIRPVESIAMRILRFSFQNGGAVVMTPTGDPPISTMIDGIADPVRSMFSQKKLKDLAGATLKKLETIIEPLHYGKFVD